jgi:hypothetical protein
MCFMKICQWWSNFLLSCGRYATHIFPTCWLTKYVIYMWEAHNWAVCLINFMRMDLMEDIFYTSAQMKFHPYFAHFSCSLGTFRFGYSSVWVQFGLGTVRFEYSSVWVQFGLSTVRFGYSSFWVQFVLGTVRFGYSSVWVQFVLGTVRFGYNSVWVQFGPSLWKAYLT